MNKIRRFRVREDEGNPPEPVVETPVVDVPAVRNPSMREASDQSLNDRMRLVQQAVYNAYNKNTAPDQPYSYVEVVFDDYVIVCKGGALWKVPYTIADDAVTLSKPVKVKVTYTPVTEGVLFPVDEADGRVVEADAKPSGKQWGVLIIQEGLSKNRNNYGRKALQDAAPLYEGVNVYMDHEETPRRFGRSTRDKAGFLKDVHPVLLNGATQEAKQKGEATAVFALAATLCITKKDVREEMLDAYDMGQSSPFGLSHDAMCESVTVMGTPPYYDVTRIESVRSVDLVTNAAAGGRVLRLVASDTLPHTLEGDAKMLQKMIEAIKASGNAGLVAKLEALGQNPTEDQVLAIYAEAMKPQAPAAPAAAPAREAVTQPVATPTQEGADVVRLTEADLVGLQAPGMTLFLENQLRDTSLPAPVQDVIRSRFTRQIGAAKTRAALPTHEAITDAIKEQVDLFAKLAEANVVVPGATAASRVQITKDYRQQVEARLADFFDPAKPAQSFRNLYVDITGDQKITGRTSEAVRLTESLNTASFDQILGDSITRRMLADYAGLPDLNNWRGVIAEVVPVSDFRTQRRMRFGGYGNLAIVAQGGPYAALTSPTDEEATYSPAKRGGTEQITLEMITNDDVGAIRRIPGRLARAAAQTLHEFVWDFLANNSTIYDTVALAAVGHANLETTALSVTTINSLRLKMRKQTDMSNGKRITLKPRYLCIPPDLEELAFQILMADRAVPDANLAAQASPAAPNFVSRQGIKPVVVDYWTDANNYWLTASPDQAPMLEIGFLNGQEQPEIFVQDMPNVGSMFSNDAITWKIRHIYGGGVLDYRGFGAGIVA